MGPDGVKTCLRAGANDLGGTLMDETITRSAGAAHGQEMTPAAMEAIIRSVGRLPRQRDTLYSEVSDERYRASFSASGVSVSAVASAAMTGMRGHLGAAGRESYCSNDSTTL
jgi:FO synthase